MMRPFLIAIAVLYFTTLGFASAETPDLKLLRKKLISAIDSPHTTDSLYNILSRQPHTPVTTAYIGALDALKAKHTWNPYNKIKYLNASEKVMQRAVTEDPHNIEIRFMRFSIQHNVPGFLGYGKNLVADREMIIDQLNKNNYGTADKELTISIIRFLIASKRCTASESEKLHQHLNAIL